MPRSSVRIWAIALGFVLVSAQTMLAQQEKLQSQLAELSKRFPSRTEAEGSYLAWHLDPLLSERRQDRILVITWLTPDAGVSVIYQVTKDGKVYSGIDIYNWAHQASGIQNELNAEELKTLQKMLAKLPRTTTRPEYDRTVYVSFYDDNNWRTEAYDSDKFPAQFEAVMKMIGEREVTRKRRLGE